MFRVPAPGIRTKSIRDYSSVGVGAGSRQALGIAKDFDATAVGSGAIYRDMQAYRLFSAVGEANPSLDKKLSLSLPATGIGSSVRTAKVFKDTFDAVGEGVSTRTARVSKAFDLVEGIGAGSIEREWQAYRQFDAAGQGVGSIDRVVTFVRQFDAIGVGEISSFRLCLDADDLPDPGGGGSVTNYIFGVFE
ncbi:MAG: hypothetical protein CMN85_10580 [Spongiibacteraceae bacterium]|nr:hypothetical protein [Spongiibacteraceae bacterium]